MKSLSAERLANISDDLILSAVGEDHRLVDINPAWISALGWKEDDLLGSCLATFIAPDDRDVTLQALRVLGDGSTLTDLRVDMIGPSGLVPVDWKFYRHEGHLYGVGRVYNDQAVESRVQKVLERYEKKGDVYEDQSIEAQVALTKAQTWKAWLAGTALVASSVGGALVWAFSKIESDVRGAHQKGVHEGKQDAQLEELNQRADTDDKKFRELGRTIIQTQVQASDSTEYIVGKIDSNHPRKTADVEVPEPESVEYARKKVEAIKDKRAVDELFEFDKEAPDDPFAGIEGKKP